MSSNQYSHQMGFRATNHDRRHEGNGSSSSSRWVAPTKVHQHQPNHPSHTVAYTTQNTSDGRYVQHVDRENNYRHSEGGRDGGYAGGNSGGGGRQGGGKMGRQRRHSSNDTHQQRNLHRRPPPPPHRKNIITPTETTSSSQTLCTGPITTESTASKNNNINDDTPKLNPSIPAEARRISQRLRQVLFGKNTVGYEEYIKKVPKDKRRQRSLECPMTPDHRADIPAKRWQGLLNAWRRALHQYDPVDLQPSSQTTITLAPRPCSTKEDVQEEEIAQAKASGLQVAFGCMNVGEEARLFSMKVANDDNNFEEIMMKMNAGACDGCGMEDNNENGQEGTMNEVSHFDEEAAYQKAMMMGGGDTGLLDECESDSDDDIL